MDLDPDAEKLHRVEYISQHRTEISTPNRHILFTENCKHTSSPLRPSESQQKRWRLQINTTRPLLQLDVKFLSAASWTSLPNFESKCTYISSSAKTVGPASLFDHHT